MRQISVFVKPHSGTVVDFKDINYNSPMLLFNLQMQSFLIAFELQLTTFGFYLNI